MYMYITSTSSYSVSFSRRPRQAPVLLLFLLLSSSRLSEFDVHMMPIVRQVQHCCDVSLRAVTAPKHPNERTRIFQHFHPILCMQCPCRLLSILPATLIISTSIIEKMSGDIILSLARRSPCHETCPSNPLAIF